MSWLLWCCTACGHRAETGARTLAERLQAARPLKRAGREEQRDTQYLLTLANAAGNRLACPARGAANYRVQSGESDRFALERACKACGRPIPAQRLELFPEAGLCAACQTALDLGRPLPTVEYCPRCSTLLVVRAGGAGATRYALSRTALKLRWLWRRPPTPRPDVGGPGLHCAQLQPPKQSACILRVPSVSAVTDGCL
jgi:RNA polymerase-binding transcription factor DksA